MDHRSPLTLVLPGLAALASRRLIRFRHGDLRGEVIPLIAAYMATEVIPGMRRTARQSTFMAVLLVVKLRRLVSGRKGSCLL